MKNLQNISSSRPKAAESPMRIIRSSSSSRVGLNPMSKSLAIEKKEKTPHIDLFNIRELKLNEPENVMKNFGQMMKQIIDTKNSNFLDGNINLIEYILSKYTTIPLDRIGDIERLSLKITFEYGLLNQFGQYLPNLKELILNYSVIPSFSDVGSTFTNLKELYITDTGLKDINGNYNYNI